MGTKRPRYAYKGEPEGSLLAAYLNGDLDGVKPTAAEAEELRALLQAVCAMRRREKHPLAHQLGCDDRRAWLLEIFPVLDAHPKRTYCFDEHDRYRITLRAREFQGWAVHYVCELAKRGLEGRLRVCRQCGQWFYAHREKKQKFCNGGRCRKKHCKQSPEFKEYKARLMRERYATPVEPKSRK
jgi:hypothetical protein